MQSVSGTVYPKLVDNLKARFLEDDCLRSVAALCPSAWPTDTYEQALIGDGDVYKLAEKCHVNAREALDEFRLYKNNTKIIGTALRLLHKHVELLPVSSAECERCFSCMNLHDTDYRSRLNVVSLSALLFIRVNGPNPSSFDPTPYATKWLKAGGHSAVDTAKSKSDSEQHNPDIAALF